MSVVSTLSVIIGADTAGFTRGLNSVNSQINSLGSNLSSAMSSAGSALQGLGVSVTALTAPIAAFGAIGIDAAADFENTMAEISARTGIVGEDLQSISDFALQMGADTSFSSQQAADAFLQLLSSGQTASDALSTLPFVLDAAAASGEDLGRTADVLTDIMASFGLPVSEAETVVNALAQAAGASSADMASLGEGFGNIGGIAKAFGLDVKTTAAALAVLSENGTKGAEAGTALKSMLMNMTRVTDDVQGEWSALGISFYDAQGNTRDLGVVMGELKKVMEGMPAEKQNKVMTTLFGSYGRVAAEALMGSISIEEMKAAMDGSASAADVADARMNTFTGRIDSLKGSVETLMITALTPFMDDVLSPLAVQFTGLINNVTSWADANPGLTSAVVALGAAAVILGPALVTVGTALTLAAPAVGALGVALGLIVSPLGLAVAGIAGLALYLNSQGFDFTGFANNIGQGLSRAVAAFSPENFSSSFSLLAVTVQDEITNSFSGMNTSGIQPLMETHFNDILNAIVSIAGVVLGGPVGMAIGAARLVGLAIENDFLGIGTFLESSGIKASVETAIGNLKSGIDDIISQVFSGGGGQQNDVGAQLAATFGRGAEGAAEGGPLQVFISDLQTGFDALKKVVSDVWANIGPGLTDFANGISGFIASFDGTETEGLLRVVTGIGAFIGAIAGAGLEVGSEVLGTLLSALGNSLPMLGAGISDFITAISRIGEGDVGGAVTSIGNVVTDLVNSIAAFFGIEITVPDFSDAIEGWRAGLEGVKQILDTIGQGVTDAINNLVSGARQAINEFLGLIIKAQIAFTDLQIFLNYNVEANQGFKKELEAKLAGLQATGVPSFEIGGTKHGDGLAYLHDGERVLNKQETREYNSPGMNSGNPTIINIHGVSDIDRILFEFQRMGIQVKPA